MPSPNTSSFIQSDRKKCGSDSNRWNNGLNTCLYVVFAGCKCSGQVLVTDCELEKLHGKEDSRTQVYRNRGRSKTTNTSSTVSFPHRDVFKK